MADSPRSLPPAAPPPSRGRSGRLLAVLGILVVGLVTLGAVYWDGLVCTFRECPRSAAEQPADPDESGAPGQFLLRLGDGVELDTDVPLAVSAAEGHLDDGDLFYDDRRPPGSSLYTADHPLAVWTGEGAPDSADCLDAIVSAGVWRVDPKPGQVVCIQTTEGRIGTLTVTQVLNDGVTFVSTIWS